MESIPIGGELKPQWTGGRDRPLTVGRRAQVGVQACFHLLDQNDGRIRGQ